MPFPKPKAKICEQVRKLRAATRENTTDFGARFARSARTVEDWEQGRRTPDVLAQRLLNDLDASLQNTSNP